jgi:hypothetical protein
MTLARDFAANPLCRDNNVIIEDGLFVGDGQSPRLKCGPLRLRRTSLVVGVEEDLLEEHVIA